MIEAMFKSSLVASGHGFTRMAPKGCNLWRAPERSLAMGFSGRWRANQNQVRETCIGIARWWEARATIRSLDHLVLDHLINCMASQVVSGFSRHPVLLSGALGGLCPAKSASLSHKNARSGASIRAER
jgi:hypothetical protein